MQVTTKRSLGGIFLLVAIVSFWCFLSGFEQPWTNFHMASLIIWPIALALAGFFYSQSRGGERSANGPVRKGCNLAAGNIVFAIVGGLVGGYFGSLKEQGDAIFPMASVVGFLAGLIAGPVLFSIIWACANGALSKSQTGDSQEPPKKP